MQSGLGEREIDPQLDALNTLLEPIGEQLAGDLREPTLPTIFVVGTPRCGHTVLGQLLVARYRLAYPSNLIARTWRAIAVGARLQRLTLEGVPRVSEPAAPASEAFESRYGGTPGVLGLHEFGYFWTEHLRFGRTHALSPAELDRVDTAKLLRSIAVLEQEGGRLPTLFKNGTLGFQAAWLSRLLPKAVFVHCHRAPIDVAQSILRMREEQTGSRDRWFSFRPPETPELLARPYWEQIAGQIAFTLKHVRAQLELVPQSRQLEVRYDHLCAEPQTCLEDIAALVSGMGHNLELQGEIPARLSRRTGRVIDDDEYERLVNALAAFDIDGE